MVVIKGVSGKSILDTRNAKTIQITINTNVGKFSASAPSGKSTGKFAKKIYKKDLDGDIKALKEFTGYFSEDVIENFSDLRRIEDICEGHVGANTIFALESAVLKALAKEQKKQVWQVINPKAKRFPRFVGNCVGGGSHSELVEGKKPDFQEFLLIPNLKSPKESFEKNKKIKQDVRIDFKKEDEHFTGKTSDENAWMTSMNEKEVLEILDNKKIPLGLDVAASSFYKRKKYHYKHPMLDRTPKEQLSYISNLIKNFSLFYIEDPFQEEDFESFAKLTKAFPTSLIVGDDLIVTNPKRLEKAIKIKAINGVIVKPNQIGSLVKVKRVVEMAKENGIKTIFSHRSGETEENILADLAFGFGADFIKAGIDGKGREVKLKRLVEIEKGMK